MRQEYPPRPSFQVHCWHLPIHIHIDSTANYLSGTMPLYDMGEFVLGMCFAMVMERNWRRTFRVPPAIRMTAFAHSGLVPRARARHRTARGCASRVPVGTSDAHSVRTSYAWQESITARPSPAYETGRSYPLPRLHYLPLS